MNHTPGPWAVETRGLKYPLVIRRKSGGFTVMDIDLERALADAKPIAAALELLEALTRILQENRHLNNLRTEGMARAAIFKPGGTL